MKKLTILAICLLLILTVFLVVPELSHAQPPPPPGKPQQTPIDGGLGLLAAAGGAYAIKKLRDRRAE
jgi:hypothetical protein